MPMGQRIVAAALNGSIERIDRQLAVALLLNVAVILFAWRRSKDLKDAIAAGQAAARAAHDNAFVDHVTGLANRRELMRVLTDSDTAASGSKLLLLDL